MKYKLYNNKLYNNKSYKIIYYILFVLISLLICLSIYIIYSTLLYKDIINYSKSNYNLDKDGLHVIKNLLSKIEIDKIKEECYNTMNLSKRSGDKEHTTKEYIINNKRINDEIKKHIHLGNDYQFQDYIFIIQKSSIHTCHRDANGYFFNEGQIYPSYTIIIFLEDMDKCLGVIPRSHLNENSFNFNLTDKVQHIVCNSGDAIIFNSNLIHVGSLNNKDDNLRIQMKITHKDDIQNIPYYNNYNKVLNETNYLPFYLKKAQQNLSCMFPILSNSTQNEVKRISNKKESPTFFQKAYSFLLYGNTNFYNDNEVRK